MRKNLEKGASNLDAIMALIVLTFIIVAFVLPGRSPSFLVSDSGYSTDNGGSYASYNTSQIDYSGIKLETDSSFANTVSLGAGNASYAYQSYEEYITLSNRSNDPINITGWQLANGKDERTYEMGGNLRNFNADTVSIPRGTLFIRPNGGEVTQNIVLAPDETAIITTGGVGSKTPYRITSFKENICSGYLQSMDEYNFTPTLNRNCPRPTSEPGVRNLDTSCKQFIERLATCRIPDFDTRDRNGEVCSNCADGIQLSSSCVAFLKEHFSYAGCIANHSSDPNFSGKTWRIFLDQGWEMWANDHEIIKLFDQSGRLIDYKIY